MLDMNIGYDAGNRYENIPYYEDEDEKETCPYCGEPIEDDEEVGYFDGTAMHNECLELAFN